MSVLQWFSEHWIGMLITLIIIGLAIDWLVWIIRWRPYWVWFRRKRVMIDDTDLPKARNRFGREEDEWDGEEIEDIRRARRRNTRRSAEPDFFSVDPFTSYEADQRNDFVDEDSFRPKKHANMSEDPFTISTDDPDAINFWQEDVFNVSDLQKEGRAKPRARHN